MTDVAAGRRAVAWSSATWLNPPQATEPHGAHLVVTTRDRSDFWRTTSYGFVHDSGHALLTGFPSGTAIEVRFMATFEHRFDQAGLMVRVDANRWIKAGIELSDGLPQLGAVVTHDRSDWSMAPVPDWAGHEVTMRASRDGDAVTIRARRGGEPWQLVRLAPLAPDVTATAGPFCCSPERAGLRVRFTGFSQGPADAELHG